MSYIIGIFKAIVDFCYYLCKDYGLAIILFTLISKIILIPVSIWVQKNSIKMVKLQPEINQIKAKYFGDKDAIADEEGKLYKRENYKPLATLIPMIIQLVLLMIVIEAIKAGIEDPNIDMNSFGVDLSTVPNVAKGLFILSPILAGLSSLIMCVTQNISNVLQSEQSNANKYGVLIFSVALSLYLGWFVPVGVALYWIASNLMSIAQMYILNFAINPKKYIDYEALEESKKALAELGSIGEKKQNIFQRLSDPNIKRERADYKKFFSIVNKHLVFYSESGGFYKYYRGLIEWLLANTNLTIHYITSDPDDAVFELSGKESRIKPYYIGEKRLITLMMKMDADIVAMTMPDIENFHIKRSYVRKDIEYLYIPHYMDSANLTMRKGCLDHYDTVFCTGRHQVEEARKTEEAYNTKEKKLIEWGYCLLDEMIADYESKPHKENETKQILIAPSWQADNIVDSCLEDILNALKDKNYNIIVRPHPQHVRHRGEYMEALKEKYKSSPNIEIQTDFSSSSTVMDSDLIITDWSSIAYEFAFTTKRPVLFINTPMKVMNPEYTRIDTVPINIWMRDKIGASIDLDKLGTVGEKADELIQKTPEYNEIIREFVNEYVYNPGHSAEVGGKYIMESLMKRKAN
ncbi:MAG: membrane protein insertase YidC [Lachnospiraceae bacterium]|nr:membrane protein insertase YidC [Lachnospiraceae bacterium]